MSGAAAQRRKAITWMAGAALVAVVLGASTFLPPREEQKRAEVGKRVLPEFSANADKVGLVMVTTSEESYHLVHNADGWVLPEKGSYPASPSLPAPFLTSRSTVR
jgi:hypothetical protein